MKTVCRFKFAGGTRREFIEASITTAIFCAECTLGKPRVKVSGVGYYIAEDGTSCVIDVSTKVGDQVALVFTAMMINTLGEDEFHVRRIEGEPIPAAGKAE